MIVTPRPVEYCSLCVDPCPLSAAFHHSPSSRETIPGMKGTLTQHGDTCDATPEAIQKAASGDE
jgi:formate hydrogenlyase subunit 6/NADH:ubiquinone oxidoreductase subunit I